MSRGSFGLAVQTLTRTQQVLVLGHVVGIRNSNGWFSTTDLDHMIRWLKLPAVPNTSAVLGYLRSSDLIVRRRETPPWALSPKGTDGAIHLLGDFDYARINAELAELPGAEFANAVHTVIPPEFAPPRWQQGISRLLERFPFESNVFLMTRFPKNGAFPQADHLSEVVEAARGACSRHGLTLHLASDRIIEDDLLGNVGAYIWACQFGIGLLEQRLPDAHGLNQNTLIEIGSMLMTGRRCAILKDRTSPTPPSDIAGQIYKSVDFDCLQSVSERVHQWISEDLGLGRCGECL